MREIFGTAHIPAAGARLGAFDLPFRRDDQQRLLTFAQHREAFADAAIARQVENRIDTVELIRRDQHHIDAFALHQLQSRLQSPAMIHEPDSSI